MKPKAILKQVPATPAAPSLTYTIEEDMEDLDPFRQAWAILETMLCAGNLEDIDKHAITAAARLIEAGINALAPAQGVGNA